MAEESLKKHLTEAEQHPGYNHPTYELYATRYKSAKQLAVAN